MFIVKLLVWRPTNACAPVIFILRVNLPNAQDKSQVVVKVVMTVGRYVTIFVFHDIDQTHQESCVTCS